MKTRIYLAAFVGIAVSAAHGTGVTFSGVPTARPVVNASDTLLTSGLVWAGNFSNTSFGLNTALSLQANVTQIAQAGGWKQFGLDTTSGTPNEGLVSSLGVFGSGRIAGEVTDNTAGSTKADYFNNKDLYLWVFNGSTVATSTQMGIFRATSATPPWVFATNANGVSDKVTYSTTVDNAAVINAIGGVGSASAGSLKLTNSFNVTLAPIPEPSTALFGLLTVVAAAGSRRRRSCGRV